MSARPFYLISHRCNTPEALGRGLRQGANAVECDVRVVDGKLVISHDALTGEFPLDEYLRKAKEAADAFPALALIIFDCKSGAPEDAKELRRRVRETLTDPTKLNALYSIGDYKAREFFDGIWADLSEREGIAIDQDDSPSLVSSYFRGLSRKAPPQNHCYGNGIFILGPGGTVRRSIRLAVASRSNFGSKLVYVWTINEPSSLRDYLRLGADGVFVNDAAVLGRVLEEAEFRDTIRLATRAEIAFQLPHWPAYLITIRTGGMQNAGTDANVFLTIVGANGSTAELVLDTPGHDDFERGSEITYVVTAPDVGPVTAVKVRHDGSGIAPGWYVDWVRIRRDGDEWHVPCETWLSGDTLEIIKPAEPAPTGPQKWFLGFSPKSPEADDDYGRPWADGTQMALRAKSTPAQDPWDTGCAVETFISGFAAMNAIRDTFEQVIEAGKGGHVYIAGWRFNPQRDLSTENDWGLEPWPPEKTATHDQTAMGLVLRLVETGVDVRLLLWMPAMLGVVAGFRPHMLDHYDAAWIMRAAPRGIAALDMRTANLFPPVASHHQKAIVVRSGKIHEAFVGGVDLAFTRRDAQRTSSQGEPHFGDWQSGEGIPPPSERWPRQAPPADKYYAPVTSRTPPKAKHKQPPDLPVLVYSSRDQRWHDQYLRLRGPIVRTLEAQFAERWIDQGESYTLDNDTNWNTGQVMFSSAAAFDGDAIASLEDTVHVEAAGTSAVQMWRTIPPRRDRTRPPFTRGEFTIAAGVAHAVKTADELIWIFDQYLWSAAFARLVNERLWERGSLHVIVVLPPHADGEDPRAAVPMVQHEARFRALKILTKGVEDRVAAYNMWDNEANRGIYVHAKAQTYDDSLLVCGSANLNRRSLLCDSELACAVQDRDVVVAHQEKLWSLLLPKAAFPAVDLRERGSGEEFFAAFKEATRTIESTLLMPDSWTDDVVLPNNIERERSGPWCDLLYTLVADPSSLHDSVDLDQSPTLDEVVRRLETIYDSSGRFPYRSPA